MDQSDELSSIEKLARRDAATLDDGSVEVEVFDWRESNDMVTIEFLTPTNDREQEEMAFPKAGGDLSDYKFYRILQSCDLSVRNAELLKGETIRARVSESDRWGEEWRLVDPREPTLLERLVNIVPDWALALLPSKPKPDTIKTLIEVTIAFVWLALIVFTVLVVAVVVL